MTDPSTPSPAEPPPGAAGRGDAAARAGTISAAGRLELPRGRDAGPAISAGGSGATPRLPGKAPGRWRAIGLALVMHGLLIALLVVGIRWQTQKPVAVQAELWQPPPEPPPQPPPPKPEPPKPEPPPPEVKPEPPPEVEKPDIALEKAREEKARKAREAEEQARAERKRRELEEKREAEKKAAEAKAAEARARKEAEERQREADARKAAEARKLAEAKAKKEAEQEEKRRADYVKQLVEKAGSPDGSRGAAQRGAAVGAEAGGLSGAADGEYGAKVASAIRANTVYAQEIPGNPRAIFTVALSPDCTVLNVRLKRSSGVPSWDQAAERAIRRTDPFPRPRGGRCAGELEIGHGPKDER